MGQFYYSITLATKSTQQPTKQPTFIEDRFKELSSVPNLICRYVNTKKTQRT